MSKPDEGCKSCGVCPLYPLWDEADRTGVIKPVVCKRGVFVWLMPTTPSSDQLAILTSMKESEAVGLIYGRRWNGEKWVKGIGIALVVNNHLGEPVILTSMPGFENMDGFPTQPEDHVWTITVWTRQNSRPHLEVEKVCDILCVEPDPNIEWLRPYTLIDCPGWVKEREGKGK